MGYFLNKPYSKINEMMGDVVFSTHYSRCDEPCGIMCNKTFTGLNCEEYIAQFFGANRIFRAPHFPMNIVVLEELRG